MKAYAHELVAETCCKMAEAMFEALALDNEWIAHWRSMHPGASDKLLRKSFIKRTAFLHAERARATLTQMLTTAADETLKDQIAGALIADNVFREERNAQLRRWMQS